MIFYKLFFIFLLRISANFLPDMNERQLLIFGKEAYPVLVQQQVALLNKESMGIKERDIVVTVVETDNPIRKKYAVKQGVFMVLLVGKDGTEKYRTTQLVLSQQLFALVDAMPMRQAEMQRKKPQ